MSKVCVLLADGCEEIEAVTIIDVLRRAQVEVTTLALTALRVKGAHGIDLMADQVLDSSALKETWDMVVLPGGQPGSDRLRDDARVSSLLEHQLGKQRRVAAICAAPIALAKHGMLKGVKATCYPGFEDQLRGGGAEVTSDRVVVDGLIVTGRGPGVALEFSLALVFILKGRPLAESLQQGMLAQA